MDVQSVQYGVTPAANPTTVPNTDAAQNGGPLTNAIATGAKETYNFVSEHADPINDAVKSANAFRHYGEDGNMADLWEGIEAAGELLFDIGMDLTK